VIAIEKSRLDPRGFYRMSIVIDPKLHDAFKMTAAERGESMSKVIGKFIWEYVKRYKPEALPKENGGRK